MSPNSPKKEYTRKDFASDQEVRWCPGCGDYAILAAVQRTLPSLGSSPENTVFISGIGCSSRFPYYMNTYGFHTIHGRAPAIATGLKLANPKLDVWVITGDGDGLSIGGNHLLHVLRRNIDLQIMLFNNQIYGLTKGQYSPTSQVGKVTPSSPFGSIDQPVVPVRFALGARATFVARAFDTSKKLPEALGAARKHKGAPHRSTLERNSARCGPHPRRGCREPPARRWIGGDSRSSAELFGTQEHWTPLTTRSSLAPRVISITARRR